MLHVGKKAPIDVSVIGEGGMQTSLRDYAGKYVVLYFYPKDMTPGCTTEACNFRDAEARLKKLGATIIGVSKDGIKAHEKFTAKYNLNFPLWADEEHALAEAFGVWGERKFMGRTYMGMSRSTFLIDPNGVVVHVWEKVKPEGHAEEVEEILTTLLKK